MLKDRTLKPAGTATEVQLRKVINAALQRIGEGKLDEPTIKEQLDTWIKGKSGAVSEATILAYQQARDLFLKFLGPRSRLSVRVLRKSDVIAFRDQLFAEGRTESTVNKICKKYLTGPFESARKEGLIDFNPFVAADALKVKKIEKDTFWPRAGCQPDRCDRQPRLERGNSSGLLHGHASPKRCQSSLGFD